MASHFPEGHLAGKRCAFLPMEGSDENPEQLAVGQAERGVYEGSLSDG